MDNTSQEIELSIVMPCLNEALTLGICIQKSLAFLKNSNTSGEIVIADNGSTDGSQKIASDMGARVIDVQERGYGAALIGGIAAAQGKYVIMGDADDSYDFSSLMSFLDELRKGTQLVMGNRFLGGILPGAMPLLHRYLGNPVLSSIGRIFFHIPIHDFHCGLRGFDRCAISKLDLRATGMEFASEMIVKSALHGLTVCEVPMILHPDGRDRPPHLRTWRDGWRHLRFLLMYSPRWLFFYPGLSLILLSLLITLWLLPAPQKLGPLVFDVNTMLFSALAGVCGFQSLCFAVFTRVFAVYEGFLPPDNRLDGWLKAFSLERGLFAGIVTFACGFALSIASVVYWHQQGLGPLNPSLSLRLVIPGGTLVTLGIQMVFASFFLSIMRMNRH